VDSTSAVVSIDNSNRDGDGDQMIRVIVCGNDHFRGRWHSTQHIPVPVPVNSFFIAARECKRSK
jgi:hypothetical protein